MKRQATFIWSWIALALIASVGCETVVTTVPIGERVTLDDEEVQLLNGTWTIADHAIHVRAEVDGTIRFAAVEWKEDRFKMHETSGYLSIHDDRVYLLLAKDDDDEADVPHYDFSASR